MNADWNGRGQSGIKFVPGTSGAIPVISRWRNFAASLCLLASCNTGVGEFPGEPFAVNVESRSRRTSAGDRVAYDLYLPVWQPDLVPPPYPAVILTHGFARSKEYHKQTARRLAGRGIVVMTHDMVSLLGGEPARDRNIANLADHVGWLIERNEAQGDPIRGLIDPARIALAGHSAGGAVSFEAAIEATKAATPVAAVCLLDGVPWERTVSRASEYSLVPLASFRADPQGCNANGSVVQLLKALPISVQDVRIVGATHCDPEAPTDITCRLACGGSDRARRTLFQELLYAFLRESLGAPALEGLPTTVAEAIAEAGADVEVTEIE